MKRADALAALPNGFEQVEAAADVDAGVIRGVGDALAHIDLCREMTDDVESRLAHQPGSRLIRDVHLVERRRRRNLAAIPAHQVVDDRDLEAVRDQRVRDVRADEAGSASHESAPAH